MQDYGSAGPSNTTSSSRSRSTRTPILLERDEAEKMSLYRDDPEDPDFDDIEISSPPPTARRMGTRAVPSASQSLVYDVESDIEDFDDPPQPRVTMIQPEDVGLSGPDPEIQCKKDLDELREEVCNADWSWYDDDLIRSSFR